MMGIQGAFQDIRGKIIGNARKGVETFQLSVATRDTEEIIEVSYRNEAMLFSNLYKGINDFKDKSRLLDLHIYPTIGKMVSTTPGLKELVSAALVSHAEKYDAPLAEYMSARLIYFDLAEISPDLNEVSHRKRNQVPNPGF